MKITTEHYWRNHLSDPIKCPVSRVSKWLSAYPAGRVFVGCDSKVRGDLVKYATVICLWDVGKGVKEIYRNEVTRAPKDSYTRLWNEVTRATETAELLKGLGEITVHIDINSDPQYPSNRLYDAGIGLINSLGFAGAGKPYSWAASCGAHRHCQ